MGLVATATDWALWSTGSPPTLVCREWSGSTFDGRVAVQRAYGLAHRGLGVPTTVDTQFAIASGSKCLTALTVMSLVERGELALRPRPDRCSATTSR